MGVLNHQRTKVSTAKTPRNAKRLYGCFLGVLVSWR
jgi:hypothetical protein